MTIRFQVGFNRILIVESKESDEPNNGLEIYQRHSKKWETQRIASQYHLVDSVAEVVALIESLVHSVTTEGVLILPLNFGHPLKRVSEIQGQDQFVGQL